MANITSEYIKELLIKFPKSGDRTIANLAFKKEPKLFNSYEHCRGIVKRLRAEIKTIEACRYGTDKAKCTKIEFEDNSFIKVTESYKSVRDTYKVWQSSLVKE